MVNGGNTVSDPTDREAPFQQISALLPPQVPVIPKLRYWSRQRRQDP
jgi:hypothetical protein